MDPEKNTQIESAEELEAEKSHLAEVKEEDIRSEIISEFGFDEEVDKERIEKAVARELKSRKALSSAIGQKVKYRSELTKFKDTPPTDNSKTKVLEFDLDKKLAEALEKRDLESLEYPEEIKKEILRAAQISGTSIKNAEKDPYIVAKIEAWKKQVEVEEAALSRKNNGGKKAVYDINNPPDVDMNTAEGRAEYDKWKKEMIAQGN